VSLSGSLQHSREDSHLGNEQYGEAPAIRRTILIEAASRPDQYEKIVRDIVTVSDAKQLATEKDFAARLLYVHLSWFFETIF
jgi:hypothetical protein